jgi:hypothetical protein
MTAAEMKALDWLKAREDWDTDLGEVARTVLQMIRVRVELVKALRSIALCTDDPAIRLMAKEAAALAEPSSN